ncbi:MAG: V-type ATP synthase subunit F [Clostridiales bacterium]|nr:V-type ATP synthase subunit F [Clostridiales bacterium]
MKDKMAILGGGDGVLAFTAVGVDAYPVTDVEKAEELLKRLAKDYRVIFVTEELAIKLDEVISRYLAVPYPIILSVPGKDGSNGYGMEGIKKAMEKALGVDILFNKG